MVTPHIQSMTHIFLPDLIIYLFTPFFTHQRQDWLKGGKRRRGECSGPRDKGPKGVRMQHMPNMREIGSVWREIRGVSVRARISASWPHTSETGTKPRYFRRALGSFTHERHERPLWKFGT